MKNILFTICLLLIASMGYSQLKVVAAGDIEMFNTSGAVNHSVDLGKGRTAGGNININLFGTVADNASGYGFRFTRTSAASSRFSHKGTGQYQFRAEDDASLGFFTNATQRLQVAKTSGDLFLFTGQAYKLGGGSWAVLSDRRLKDDVNDYTDGLEEILKINTVKFKYNDNVIQNKKKKEYVGIIAQEINEIAPYMIEEGPVNEAFVKSSGEYMQVDPSAFTYMLINAVQEQQELIDAQNEKIDAMAALLNEVTTKIENGDFGSNTVIDAELNGLSSEIQIAQNRPNPFREYTEIDYFLPVGTNSAKLNVYDQKGALVKVVDLSASAGNGTVRLKANDIASGIYSYNLIVDGKNIETKQMIISK